MEPPCFSRATLNSKSVSFERVFYQQGNKRRRANLFRRSEHTRAVLATAYGWNVPDILDQQVPVTDAQTWELPTAFSPVKQSAGQRPKPLKINLDLLLYRARLMRQLANRTKTLAEKIDLQKQSEAALRRCLHLDPSDARTYVSLGKLLVTQRRYEEARKVYEDGCAATGGANEYIWQAWAVLEQRQGNVSRARRYFDAATAANDQHAAAWHGWGLLEKQQGDVVRARDIWMKGVMKTRSSPNPYLYQSLALLAGEMGYVAEARKWYREGTSTIKGAASHALWHAWAMLEATQGENKAVRYLFARGLESNPRSRYIFLSWALWEKQQGQVAMAKDLLMRGATLNRRDPAILQAWALLEEEGGNVEVARRLLERASKIDPHHIPVWQAWGLLEQKAGNLDRARELFQQGVWAQPGSKDVTYVWQAWGILEAEAGDPQLARQLFKCAVKADPDSVPSWTAWADLEQSLGEKDRARDIRRLRREMYNEVVLPPDFAASLKIPATEAAKMSVVTMVTDWYKRLEALRAPAKRRLPSYLAVDTDDEEQKKSSAEQVRKPVTMEAMLRFNNPQLTRRVVSGQPMVGGRRSATPRTESSFDQEPED